jgi:hypothetical protein
LWRVSAVDQSMGADRAVVGERLRCVAGLLVDRQLTPAEAARVAEVVPAVDAGAIRGAWFSGAITQEDDQQHALSALLAARGALEEGGGRGGPSGRPSVPRLLWLAVITLAALNPARLSRLSTGRRLVGVGTVAGVLVGVALVAGPLLRAIDVSPPTALVAAGFVLFPAAVVDLARRHQASPAGAGPVPMLLAVLRPGVVALVLAVAADGGAGAGVVLAAVAGIVVALARRPADAVGRFAGAVAVAGAVDLVVHGALNV